VRCASCGAELREGSRFCGACGSASLQTTASRARVHAALDLELRGSNPLLQETAGGTQVLAVPDGQAVPAAEFCLAIRLPNQPEQLHPLDRPSLQIGSARSCDIQIDDRSFDRVWVEVVARKGTFLVRDLHQAHGLIAGGVKVNEALLTSDEPVYAPNSRGQAVSFALRPIAHGKALGRFAGRAVNIRFTPDKDTLTIGRDPGNDVVVDYPLVSRFHAQLERLERHVLLSDLRSSNGTFVGGQRVHGLQELQVGDEIQIGPVRFAFQGEALEQVDDQPSVRIDAVDLVRQVGRRGNKVLLDHVSISVLPQEFIALIGGSGAGKSTLLLALAGVTPAEEGAVLYNGRDIYRGSTAFGGLIGYVPQEDILHRELSVGRALDYAARLRLPPDTSDSEHERRIDTVLAEVQMTPQKDQQISRLSGGQRKRVSIAVELLANPSVLFLDEPTSGLDPGLDKAVMQLLRDLSEQGRTIVLVTHATENIGQCDLVAFLAGGRLVYYGPPKEAPAYFSADGFPDIYTRLADTKKSDVEELRFRASAFFRAYVLERQTARNLPALPDKSAAPGSHRQLRAAAVRQWRILSERYAELVRLDRVNLSLLLAQTPIVACALAVVTSRELYTSSKINNTQQILLMLTVATLWFSMSNAAREIVKERAVYLRERLINLRLFPYILSKVGVLTVLAILQTVALFWIVRLKTPHLPSQGILLPAPLEMTISLVLCAAAGLLGGLLISSLVKSTDRAMTIVPIVLIPQVIFSGAVFELTGWAKVLSYLTISHWCLAALGSTVKINDLIAQVPGSSQALPYAHNPGVTDLTAGWPKEMYASPDQAHLLGYWGALGVFCVLFIAATYFALRRGDHGAGTRAQEGPSGRTWLMLLVPPVLVCAIMALVSAI
jgi:ABC-type multidrug transport system ATPase subunit